MYLDVTVHLNTLYFIQLHMYVSSTSRYNRTVRVGPLLLCAEAIVAATKVVAANCWGSLTVLLCTCLFIFRLT